MAKAATARDAGRWVCFGLAALIGLRLWLIITHAPWRDELQAYLLVRDSAGLPGLFANLHYEGHPSLWYLVLGLAVAIVHAPLALVLVQIVVALTTTALVWLHAPFKAWLKLLILAGYFLLFEYGVIARSYGLGALLVFAWLALRRTRWSWPILALMANVAVHFALLSACLAAVSVWMERRWSWRGLAVWAGGCLVAVVTILPAHDLQTGASLASEPLLARGLDALRRQSANLIPALVGVWPYRWQVLLPAPIGVLAGLAAAAITALAVRREPCASLLVLALFTALTILCALVYPTYLRHVGVLTLLAIAMEWMRMETRCEPASPVFIGWMGVGAVCGLWAAGCALWVPFSPDRQEARWIARHHLQTARWAAYPGYAGTGFAAYVGRPVYNLQKQCLNSYIRWDAHAYDDIDDDVLQARISAPGPFAYLLSDEDLTWVHAPIHLIARFDRGLGDNDDFVYAVDRPAAGAASDCG